MKILLIPVKEVHKFIVRKKNLIHPKTKMKFIRYDINDNLAQSGKNRGWEEHHQFRGGNEDNIHLLVA